MNEYLYILFLVAWLAFSIYQQNQKKKRKEAAKKLARSQEHVDGYDIQQQQTQERPIARPVEQEKPKPEYQKVLEEILLGKQISFETTPDEEVQSIEEAPYTEYSQEGRYPKSFEEKGTKKPLTNWSGSEIEYLKKEAENLEKETVMYEEEEEINLSEHHFNLRNAIIYSEILNRKYVN